uniref:Uncharacterized protein n=1 Tax=Arundo donax TaxID=35708 RepID=A0A0A9AIV1_ARUDO
MVASQTTEVPGTDGPGVAAQEAGVVGTPTVMTDLAVVAGALDLTMTVGQVMMTGQVVREDQTVPHPLVAAHHLTVAVARHPSVVVHHPLVVGTEASAVLASTAANRGTEHQTARTSRR